MAKYSRIDVALKMKEIGIVPVFFHPDPEMGKAVLKACYEGGIRVFEFTNRGDGAMQVFEELLKFTRSLLPEMRLGIGSVMDGATSSLFVQMGADFIVSPILNQEIAKVCNRRKVMWIPGCGSLTKISQGEEWGAEIVKIFPATQVGGPAFIKSVQGPCPWTNIMPTGGVSPDRGNLKEWFQAGAWCVGIGSKLFPKEILAKGEFNKITETVRDALSVVRECRAN